MALTADQQSAQDYINDSSSGMGGTDKYVQTQSSRLQAAQASGDTDLINRLNADAARTGLSYSSNPTPTSTPTPMASTPTTPTTPTTSVPASTLDPSRPVSSVMGITPSTTATPPATNTTPTLSDGSLHLNVNGQPEKDVSVYKGTSFDTARNLADQLGLEYKSDPKTGEITIGGTKVMPTGYDKLGNPVVGIRNVADALGYKIGYDDSSKTITVTKPVETPLSAAQATQPMQNSYQSPINTIASFMPQQQPMTAYQQPDLSGFQSQMMPYQSFNNDMTPYYASAHNQLDPQFNANNQKLMDKQATDLTASDESMNRRGIYSSGVAQAAENDLRAKTTNALAAGFTAQMSQIEKTAQTLHDAAYKQFQSGNDFALKNNQAQMTNMLNQEKQSFAQWAQTQKLTQSQYNYALKAWDDMASKIMTDAENQAKASQFQQTNDLNTLKATLPYQQQTANNIANNQTTMDKALLPYQAMTQYQQATTTEKAQMDAATNYFKQQGINVDTAKLMEAITHNRNTESLTANGQQITANHNAATEANAAANTQLNAYKAFGYGPNGEPTMDRQKLTETITHDNALVDIARTNATNSENKTVIDGIGKQLTSINGQINAILSNPTTDKNQQTANTAMVSKLNQDRNTYIDQLKQYTDKGFYTPPTGN